MKTRIVAIGGVPLGQKPEPESTPIGSRERIHALRLKHEAALESVRSARWQIEHGADFRRELVKAVEHARVAGIRLQEALAEMVEDVMGESYTARVVLYPHYTNEE